MTLPLNVNAATVGTVAYWRSLAPAYGARTWRGGMDAFARQHGMAIASRPTRCRPTPSAGTRDKRHPITNNSRCGC